MKIESVDRESRFIVKRISGIGWECFNRKMAVTNQLGNYENLRKPYGRPAFNSQFHTYHIRWSGRGRYWDMDDIDVAKTKAQDNNRIFVAQRQMNWKLWQELTLQQAFNQYEELVNKGLSIPTMNIPLRTTLAQFKDIIRDGESVLSGNQKFMPILSSRHDFGVFPEVIEDAIHQLQFLGINTYGLTEADEFVNLTAMRRANALLKENDDCPIIFALNHHRHMNKYSFVNSAFAFACFGADVFSERQFFLKNLPPAMIEEMMKRTPEEFMFYDSIQGGFNKGEDQEGWYETNLTRAVLNQIPVEEGLNGYQSIVWNNALKQQSDLSALTQKVLDKSNVEQFIMNEKSKWATFYSTQVSGRT